MGSFCHTKCERRHEKQAFVSHASRDRDLAKEIARACCDADVAPYLFEFSQEFSEADFAANALSRRIEESNILLVVLGDSLSKAFRAQAWIGFEVGVARGVDVGAQRTDWNGFFSKRVICVQDIRQGIEVSVPWLDALILFDFGSEERWSEFKDAIRFLTPKGDRVEMDRQVNRSCPEAIQDLCKEDFATGNRFLQSTVMARVKCENCKSEYSAWIAIQDAAKLGTAFSEIDWSLPLWKAKCTTECPNCNERITCEFTQQLSSEIPT